MTIKISEDLRQRSTGSLLGGIIRGRFALIILGAGLLVLGIGLNWSWLVAAGIAPLLLTTLPCVAMCALGLCMTKMSGRAATHAEKDGAQDARNPHGLKSTTIRSATDLTAKEQRGKKKHTSAVKTG